LDTYFFQLFLCIIQETFIKKKLSAGLFLKKKQKSCGQEQFKIIFIFCKVPVGFLVCVLMCVSGGFFILFSLF